MIRCQNVNKFEILEKGFKAIFRIHLKFTILLLQIIISISIFVNRKRKMSYPSDKKATKKILILVAALMIFLPEVLHFQMCFLN